MTVLKTSLRNFLAHKGMMALSAVAVLLSVAFVCGTLVFTDTINATFDRLFTSTAADVTISAKEEKGAQRTGKPSTVPASLVEEVKKIDGVSAARIEASSENITAVNEDNDPVGPTTGAPTIGANWPTSDPSPVELTSGHRPRGPTEAVIDADTAKKKKVEIGDRLRVLAAPGNFEVRITGIAAFRITNPGAAMIFFDTKTAQTKLLGSADVTAEVDLDAAPGVSHEELKKKVLAALGDRYQVWTQEEAADSVGDELGGFLDVMKYIMLGFAAVSVLVGIFLIVITFSMLVARRTREIGLMRAVGASRRQVNRSVLAEALLLGVTGSILGIGAGIGLAVGLMELLNATGMSLDTTNLTIKATTPLAGLLLGVLVTVLAAYLPARRAGKVSPMAALREAGLSADGRSGRVRTTIGLLVTGLGVTALVAAARQEETATGLLMLVAGLVLTLVGFVVIGPLLAGLVVRGLGVVLLRAFGPVGRMAERNALRNPRRTGATAAALMIGLTLVTGLSVVGSSMVASASEALDESVGADFIVQSDVRQPINPEVVKAVKDSPDLAHVTDYTIVDAKLTWPDGKTTTEGLNAADPTFTQDLKVDTVKGDLADAYAKDAISVPESFAKTHRVTLGDEVKAAFAGGEKATFTVNAITVEETIDSGVIYANITTVERYVPDDRMPLDMIIFAKAEDGKEKAAYAALKKSLDAYPQVVVRDQADYKELLESQIGQMLNLVYGLLGLAIIVAVLGVVNTLALSVVERTREIGLMRAIGMSRRQLRRMIRLESVVIALFGAVLGLGLGMGCGIAAQKLMALEGLHVLEIPWSTIVAVFIGSALVGLIAALVPAFRASRLNVLSAIATD